MSIVVLGTVALDDVTTPFGKRKDLLGGSAVHFSIVARLFTDVHLVAVVGKDFPLQDIEFLRQKGIYLNSLEQNSGETFKWSGEYKGDMNVALTLNTHLGVLATFRPLISQKERNIKNIFLANVDPHIQKHLLAQMSHPQLVGLDSMNYWIAHERKALLGLLPQVNIYVANEQEARELSGESNLIKAAKFLHARGPEIVLIKKGEHGVFLYSQKFIFALPAYPIEKVIDPTGAGDTFAGAFMGYLSKVKKINPQRLKKAIAYGTIAASFNVEGFGTERTARLNLKDLEQRLAGFKKYVSF